MADHGQLLASEALDGELCLPGVVADVVARQGRFASIYGWTGDGSGRTREALHVLRRYGGRLVVHDAGDPGSASRSYWDRMFAEGLSTSCETNWTQ